MNEQADKYEIRNLYTNHSTISRSLSFIIWNVSISICSNR